MRILGKGLELAPGWEELVWRGGWDGEGDDGKTNSEQVGAGGEKVGW